MLTTADLTAIHETLTAHFLRADDPISPPGVKSLHMLASAVSNSASDRTAWAVRYRGV
ncbi:hypothetical protein [Tahibacter amnicola]|uniref:Uncharacterized protein n=1 Tax=Tahibacter amnicola TaxID=2976241 RepID=A0ABY6BB52_9GAMM|nr:hypothetical protein [Tahibacter amnicola]UXI66924.1 hypothetical protein N4264_19520 [Tahibacter amnicola]